MKYRIISKQYINEYGNSSIKSYYIEYEKPFLFFWKRWVRVEHEMCGMGGCYMTTTYFESLEQAEQFAVKHLCSGAMYDGFETEIVKQSKC